MIYSDLFTKIYSNYFGKTAWDFMNAGTDAFWHNDKQTISDFNHNKQWVDGCLKIAA